jgi:hypothetical protein
VAAPHSGLTHPRARRQQATATRNRHKGAASDLNPHESKIPLRPVNGSA